jgi:hypothetical protein
MLKVSMIDIDRSKLDKLDDDSGLPSQTFSIWRLIYTNGQTYQ